MLSARLPLPLPLTTSRSVRSGTVLTRVCFAAQVDLYTCHELGGRDILNQQWSVRGDTITSLSAPGRQCATLAVSTPQDCGTALWFADDSADGKTAGQKVYAVATFGELRGGNLSLVSSHDLVSWRDEGVLLTTRSGRWDNATLSTGPSPVRLSDGNWLLFYDIDNLWPVRTAQRGRSRVRVPENRAPSRSLAR